MIGTERSITITDDDASPVIVTGSPILVAENETAVATLAATDADRPAGGSDVADHGWRGSEPIQVDGGRRAHIRGGRGLREAG